MYYSSTRHEWNDSYENAVYGDSQGQSTKLKMQKRKFVFHTDSESMLLVTSLGL